MWTRERPDWLEEGEEILWSGRGSFPLAAIRGLGTWLPVLVVLYVSVAASGALAGFDEVLARAFREQPIQAAIAGLFIAAMPFAVAARLMWHRYAITSRRLVAWDRRGRLSWSLPPDLVLGIHRGWLLAASDLRFNHTVSGSGSDRKSRWTGFRCLAYPSAVRQRMVRWREEREDELRRGAGERITVTSRAGRFSLRAPVSWELREYWLERPDEARLLNPLDHAPSPEPELGEGSDWNTLVLAGPWRTSVSIESYPGAPPRRAEGGEPPLWFLRVLGADQTDRDEEARLGGLKGERVRVSLSGTRQEGPGRHRATYVFDQWTLEAEDRWYRVVALWSAALPGAEEVVLRVVETFEAARALSPQAHA